MRVPAHEVPTGRKAWLPTGLVGIKMDSEWLLVHTKFRVQDREALITMTDMVVLIPRELELPEGM